MNRTCLLVFGFALSCLSAAMPLSGDDWPQFRGANREGVWREDGIVESFSVTWPTGPSGQMPVGAGFSGPAVTGGRADLMDRVLDQDAAKDVQYQWNHRDTSRGKERIVCLDEATGKQLGSTITLVPTMWPTARARGRRPPSPAAGSSRSARWAICFVSTSHPAKSSGKRTSSAITSRSKCRLTATQAPRWSMASG